MTAPPYREKRDGPNLKRSIPFTLLFLFLTGLICILTEASGTVLKSRLELIITCLPAHSINKYFWCDLFLIQSLFLFLNYSLSGGGIRAYILVGTTVGLLRSFFQNSELGNKVRFAFFQRLCFLFSSLRHGLKRPCASTAHGKINEVLEKRVSNLHQLVLFYNSSSRFKTPNRDPCMPVCRSIRVHLCPAVCFPVCISVCLSVYLSVSLCLCISVCLSV